MLEKLHGHVNLLPRGVIDRAFRFEEPLARLGLLREVLDAGLILLSPASNEVSARCLWRTRLVVAIPESSSLASSQPVSLPELSGVAAVWLAREVNPALYDRLCDTCHKNGCLPNVARTALTYDEMLDAISSGVGIGFVKESTARRVQMEGVVFRELKDVQMSVEVGCHPSTGQIVPRTTSIAAGAGGPVGWR